MLTRDQQNDLMFEGSDGYIAAHQNVEYVGFFVLFIAIVFGYWLGLQEEAEKTSKFRNHFIIGAIIAFAIGGGVIMGLQGGIIIVMWAAFGGLGGFFMGRRRRNSLAGK